MNDYTKIFSFDYLGGSKTMNSPPLSSEDQVIHDEVLNNLRFFFPINNKIVPHSYSHPSCTLHFYEAKSWGTVFERLKKILLVQSAIFKQFSLTNDQTELNRCLEIGKWARTWLSRIDSLNFTRYLLHMSKNRIHEISKDKNQIPFSIMVTTSINILTSILSRQQNELASLRSEENNINFELDRIKNSIQTKNSQLHQPVTKYQSIDPSLKSFSLKNCTISNRDTKSSSNSGSLNNIVLNHETDPSPKFQPFASLDNIVLSNNIQEQFPQSKKSSNSQKTIHDLFTKLKKTKQKQINHEMDITKLEKRIKAIELYHQKSTKAPNSSMAIAVWQNAYDQSKIFINTQLLDSKQELQNFLDPKSSSFIAQNGECQKLIQYISENWKALTLFSSFPSITLFNNPEVHVELCTPSSLSIDPKAKSNLSYIGSVTIEAKSIETTKLLNDEDERYPLLNIKIKKIGKKSSFYAPAPTSSLDSLSSIDLSDQDNSSDQNDIKTLKTFDPLHSQAQRIERIVKRAIENINKELK